MKIDLHTHSVASYDGGIKENEYEEIITKKILDVVAITDHNRIDFAKQLHKKLGDNIIVGEEIMTDSGEIIGLFLNDKITPNLSIKDTINAIRAQKAVVYIPHPFDIFRHGIGEKNLLENIQNIDIIEGFNGRMIWRKNNDQALNFAKAKKVPIGVGSDAHSKYGIGQTYANIEKFEKKDLMTLLSKASYNFKYQPLFAYIYPKLNKISKTLFK